MCLCVHVCALDFFGDYFDCYWKRARKGVNFSGGWGGGGYLFFIQQSWKLEHKGARGFICRLLVVASHVCLFLSIRDSGLILWNLSRRDFMLINTVVFLFPEEKEKKLLPCCSVFGCPLCSGFLFWVEVVYKQLLFFHWNLWFWALKLRITSKMTVLRHTRKMF